MFFKSQFLLRWSGISLKCSSIFIINIVFNIKNESIFFFFFWEHFLSSHHSSGSLGSSREYVHWYLGIPRAKWTPSPFSPGLFLNLFRSSGVFALAVSYCFLSLVWAFRYGLSLNIIKHSQMGKYQQDGYMVWCFLCAGLDFLDNYLVCILELNKYGWNEWKIYDNEGCVTQ